MPDRKPRIFVIMPFDSTFDPVYEKFIASTFEAAGCDVFRGDDIRSLQNVMKDVVQSILECDLVVADLTDENPNVFYELGLAHAFDKPVILLTQSIDDVPFDLRSYRLLSYSTHFAEIEQAQTVLQEYAEKFVRGELLFGSPVSDFRAETEIDPRPRSPEIVRTDMHDERASPDDDRGFLDHIIDLHDGYARLTEIITTVGKETENIGKATNEVSLKIQAEAAHPSDGSASHMRKLSRGLADKLSRFGSILEDANKEYTEISLQTENSLEFIAAFQATAVEDETAVVEQRTELETLLASALSARDSYRGLARSMSDVPPMERHLGRALARASSEVQQMADNIDRTISSLIRAIDILRRAATNA